eukprot:Gregarina_sp_Poly_1__9093@NODE_556_length_7542_cov_414_325351_g438_i0_p7_GENE_NODE_556_length_7542_cov_414_325351_g438_i0NODE_556_length_7542_cov_414_325351_g438_i0_p7_ORF_typecomplete_len126_score7_34_NODE_556_length_7542_cov_414_325351_g438_i054475824
MSVLIRSPAIQRYDVQWEDDCNPNCIPLRNVSLISECAWVSSKIMYDGEDDDYLPTQNKYITSSAAAKRRAKLFYCQFKERLSNHRLGRGTDKRHRATHALAEKLAHALGIISHSNGFIPASDIT